MRDLTQSGLGDRTTPHITSFDHHVLSEGVTLFGPYASDKDANRNVLWNSDQVGLGGDRVQWLLALEDRAKFFKTTIILNQFQGV